MPKAAPVSSDPAAERQLDPTSNIVSVKEAFGLPDSEDVKTELAKLSSVREDQVDTTETETPEQKAAKEQEAKDAAAKEAAALAAAAETPEQKAAKEQEAKDAAAKEALKNQKILVGGKEYTREELEAELKKARTPPVEVAKVVPAKEPTPEEKAAQAAETKRKEDDWISTTAKLLDAPIDEALLDKILAGGKEGVAAFQELRRRDMAAAILFTRKRIHQDFEPVIRDLLDKQEPLQKFVSDAETERVVTEFTKTYPHLADRMDVVDSCAQVLLDQLGDKARAMPRDTFFKETAKLADDYIAHLQPAKTKIGNREYTREELEALVKAAPAAGATQTPEQKATAEKAAKDEAAKKTREAAAKKKPPLGSTTPGGASTAGGKSGQSVAELLP